MSAMPFVPGDPVHVAALGKGVVREVRNGERYLVEVKGRALLVTAAQLTRQETPRKAARPKPVPRRGAPDEFEGGSDSAAIDLHGKTVDEAVEAVSEFLNHVMLRGGREARIIHGRSGGKLKSAVHAMLRRIGSVRGFRVDPRNAGVTVVEL